MSKIKLIFSACMIFLIPIDRGYAQNKSRAIKPYHPVTLATLIDTPTAEILDYGSFAVANRFFGQGGLLASMSFGVFRRLMLGASVEIDRYIGSESIDLQRPQLQIKFRFYDGHGPIPAAALGFDSQGYRFDKGRNEYLEKEKGLYLTFTEEILSPGIELTAGANIADFESDALHAFIGLSWIAQGTLGLFTEYDNIHSKQWNRLNAGVNIFLSPFIQMGFYGRDLLGNKTFQNSSQERKPERIINIRYITSF